MTFAGHVFARGHAEDAGERRRQPGHQDWIRLTSRAANGTHHREDAGQPVLGAEDSFADFAEHAGRAALALQVFLEPIGIVVGDLCRRALLAGLRHARTVSIGQPCAEIVTSSFLFAAQTA